MGKKITREIWKTYGNVFSEFTNRNLFKLSSQGHFEQMKSPVSIGKEANIFTATQKDNTQIIIKIYRLESVDFKRMFDYIKFDERYVNMRRTRRSIVFSWTQREYRNIYLAREAGVRVPLPITFKDNIILMEQIGYPEPAIQLKDYTPNNPEQFFDEVIKNIKKLWDKGLVHGDLSPFNILIENDRPVFIDFSQGTMITSTNSDELLLRDLTNLSNFFKKHGVKKDIELIFKSIKGNKSSIFKEKFSKKEHQIDIK
jgi:RIO kinase 1